MGPVYGDVPSVGSHTSTRVGTVTALRDVSDSLLSRKCPFLFIYGRKVWWKRWTSHLRRERGESLFLWVVTIRVSITLERTEGDGS